MEPAPLPADPLLASVLAGRGDDFEDRERMIELNRKQDWDGLLSFAQEHQRRDPGNSDWGVVAGYAWFRRGDYPKATALLAQVVRGNPEDIGAWNLLGESQRLGGQLGQSIRTLERASAVGRTSFVTFFYLGEAYRDAQRLDQAVQAYREAVRLEPEFAGAWFALGAVCVRTGDRNEVAAALERLRTLDPALAMELKKLSEANSGKASR
jgi:tetratricopeptide (TPR) repeat protein